MYTENQEGTHGKYVTVELDKQDCGKIHKQKLGFTMMTSSKRLNDLQRKKLSDINQFRYIIF